MTLTKVAAWIQSSAGGVPNEYIRVVIASNDEERNRPNITLREIVSVPGVLNNSGVFRLILDITPPLLVQPGAIWVGAIISSGASSSTNQVYGGSHTDLGLNLALNGGSLFTAAPGYGSTVFVTTNRFSRSYNASDSAPSSWNTERAIYDTSSNSYWIESGTWFTQIWVVR